MSDQEIQYPREFTDKLEVLWGKGFLSPGGPAEVAEILKGIDLANKSVLDIGCGTGGAEIVMAQDLGAGHVTGIDIEPQLIERTQERIIEAGKEFSAGSEIDYEIMITFIVSSAAIRACAGLRSGITE